MGLTEVEHIRVNHCTVWDSFHVWEGMILMVHFYLYVFRNPEIKWFRLGRDTAWHLLCNKTQRSYKDLFHVQISLFTRVTCLNSADKSTRYPPPNPLKTSTVICPAIKDTCIFVYLYGCHVALQPNDLSDQFRVSHTHQLVHSSTWHLLCSNHYKREINE